MFAIEIVEGKDAPKERGNLEFHQNGKTSGLLLMLCLSIFHTRKVVILDSGFCVLSTIIVLKKMGVYASLLIKKRRYWPRYIKGQKIIDEFAEVDIRVAMRKPGMIDGVKFDVLAMKEPNYVLMLMSTYGCLQVKSGQKESVRDHDGNIKNFKYTETVANHFNFCCAFDDHNNKRHNGGTKHWLSIEET